jgi:hypothetical protein
MIYFSLFSAFLLVIPAAFVFSYHMIVYCFSISSYSLNCSRKALRSISLFRDASCHYLRHSSSRLRPDFVFFISYLSFSSTYSCYLKLVPLSFSVIFSSSTPACIIPPGVVLDIAALLAAALEI